MKPMEVKHRSGPIWGQSSLSRFRHWQIWFMGLLLSGLLLPGMAQADGVTANIPGFVFARGIAINRNTNRIYVTNYYEGTLSVIDGTSNTVVDTIPGLIFPTDVAVNSVTNKIYVINTGGRPHFTAPYPITVIDGAADTIIGYVPGGVSFGNGIAIDERTNRIYIGNNYMGKINVVDGASDTVVGAIPYSGPFAVNPVTNRIYVGDPGFTFPPIIRVIDGATNQVVGTVDLTSLGGPLGYNSFLAVNPATNKIYAPTQQGVVVIDGGSNTVVSIVPTAASFNPAIAINPSTNRIYVTNRNQSQGTGDTLSIIDGSTDQLSEIIRLKPIIGVLAVNPSTDKTYLQNGNRVSVIDGNIPNQPDGSGGGGDVLTVINTNDSGPGSLRDAILYANANPGTAITFNYGNNLGTTIVPLSPLPPITADHTTIDTSSQWPADYITAKVALDGANDPGTDPDLNGGIKILASNCLVRGLAIYGYHSSGTASSYGVVIDGPTASHNRVEVCYIGSMISGQSNTRGVGILHGAHDNIIGGYNYIVDGSNIYGNVFEANRIAYNDEDGVEIATESPFSTLPGFGTGNTIRGNTILYNGGLGINLRPYGEGPSMVTPNYPPGTPGPNNLQSYPVLESASLSAGGTVITGTLRSLPNTTFALDFYSHSTPGHSLYDEGQAYLGAMNVVTDASGAATFLFHTTGRLGGLFAVATATNLSTGDTSEFSQSLYVPGGWQGADLAIGADNSARFLWENWDNSILVSSVDNNGGLSASADNIYGPYTNYTPQAIACGRDGLTRVLWNRLDGMAAIWIMGQSDSYNNAYQTSFGFGFDPQAGWAAMDITVGEDQQSRVLWSRYDGSMSVWTVDNGGHVSAGPVYPNPNPNYTPARMSSGAGLTWVLWKGKDGSAGLWLMGQSGSYQNAYEAGYSFGPYPGWAPADLAVGSDGKARLLWTHTDGRIALWSISDTGAPEYGPVYGPYPGWTARAIATGSDGLTRVLWNNVDGTTGLWLAGPDNTYLTSSGFGPF